ncbi:MAG TPA: site-specific DNA-methyltransferase [Bryobacteraceae bacterium]|nr:site-specific DNA-methyltransferase [Bryobacteraceae bacterium]HXJ38723.1 site-specific DNA-methyltransferase [Bryobacteraceae bacterium]
MLTHPAAQRIEHWPLDKLIPYARNPRTHSDAQVAQIAASIAEFGFNNPILVDSSAGIIAGHGRLLAARKLQLNQVPVIVLDHLSEAQKRAYVLADNQLALNAGWDEELLRIELATLQQEDFNVNLIGFEDAELERLLSQDSPHGLTDEDAVPDVPKDPVTRAGDLWQLGPHRVLCGDATSSEAVQRLCTAGPSRQQPFLMVTDPPYGIELDSEWRDRAGLNGCGPAEASYMKHRTQGHTNTSISSDTRADWSEAFELLPGLQVAYVWHASKFTREVLDGLLRIGFLHHQQIIWNKGRTVLTRTHYWFQHEPAWYVRKKNAPWYGKAGENSTVWDSPSPKFIMGSSKEEKFDHPTQKPVELMRRPILNHTKRGELVYDPFLGSGTTLAAAETTSRVCYGLELDPKYVDVIVKRWQSFTGQRATLEMAGRTFDEIAQERLKEQA